MSEQRHTFTVDTQVAVHGCSDDTFGVYWGTSGIDDDDCAQEWERWVRVHFPDGSGLIIRGRHDDVLGWSVGATPVDEDKPVPPLVCEQRQHTMAFVFTAPAGTKFVLWSGDFDRKVLP